MESKLHENKPSSRRRAGTAFVRRFLTRPFATLKTHHQTRQPASPRWADTSSRSREMAFGWIVQGRAVIPTIPDSPLGSWWKALQNKLVLVTESSWRSKRCWSRGKYPPLSERLCSTPSCLGEGTLCPGASRSKRLMGEKTLSISFFCGICSSFEGRGRYSPRAPTQHPHCWFFGFFARFAILTTQ